MRRFLLTSLVLGLLLSVSAQPQQCPPLPAYGSIGVSAKTKAAVDSVSGLIKRTGASANLLDIRSHVLKDQYPDADVVITVKTMLHVYCEVVWSTTSLSEIQKSSQVQESIKELTAPVRSPAIVARTGSKIDRRSQNVRSGSLVLASAAVISGYLKLTQDNLALSSPRPQTEFLREPPVFINNSNKYFVIVGSAPSEDDGIRLMNQLKKKAPPYDFVLYGPYGANPNYGVMMATWVPSDVARQALQLARRYVAHDAYLWACRSSGDSC